MTDRRKPEHQDWTMGLWVGSLPRPGRIEPLERPMKCCDPNAGIFVFGSNMAGRHGAGAALHAYEHHGAIYRAPSGRQGNSYAIPTKDGALRTLPLDQVQAFVNDFIAYAQKNPDLKFFVTRIGCGLAGYTDSDIAPMFKDAPPNCQLPDGW
jgi:hypothetical protein